MVVLVTSRIRQALSHSTFYSSVVGDSMLARLRSTTIAMLGVVTAVGLALVAFISQLGFPGVFNGAIPDGPGGSAAVHGAIALTPAVGTAHPAREGRIASARFRLPSPPSSHAPGSTAGPHLGSLDQAGHVPPTGQPPSRHTQAPATVPPEPAGEPATPATESPAPSTASPKPEPPAQPGKSSSKSQSHSKGSPGEKAKGHSGEQSKGQADAKPITSSTDESKSHHSAAKAERHSGAPPKPTGDSPRNSGGSRASSAKGSSPPPSANPGEKMPPEAEGKEAGGAGKNGGKSGRSHH
jgi:hypothetical protein